MTPLKDTDHSNYLNNILKNKSYEKLEIKRFNKECYLIIFVDGKGYTLVNKKNQKISYRHAWQIKEWLEEKFQIMHDHIKVSKQKY